MYRVGVGDSSRRCARTGRGGGHRAGSPARMTSRRPSSMKLFELRPFTAWLATSKSAPGGRTEAPCPSRSRARRRRTSGRRWSHRRCRGCVWAARPGGGGDAGAVAATARGTAASAAVVTCLRVSDTTVCLSTGRWCGDAPLQGRGELRDQPQPGARPAQRPRSPHGPTRGNSRRSYLLLPFHSACASLSCSARVSRKSFALIVPSRTFWKFGSLSVLEMVFQSGR